MDNNININKNALEMNMKYFLFIEDNLKDAKNIIQLNYEFIRETYVYFVLSNIEKCTNINHEECFNLTIFTFILLAHVISNKHYESKKLTNIIEATHTLFLKSILNIINECKKQKLTHCFMNKLFNCILMEIPLMLNPYNKMNLESDCKYIIIQMKNFINVNKTLFNSNNFSRNISKSIQLYNKYSITYFMNLFKKTISYLFNDKSNELDNSILYEDEGPLYLIKTPFIEMKSNGCELTIVLDLDETLIRFTMNNNNDKGTLQMRPGLVEFLLGLQAKQYELILFTASTQDYAEPIIDVIENEGVKFHYKLFRQHTIMIDNDYIKDLSMLGRDLKRVVLVDNSEKAFMLQKKNGILIKGYYGDDEEDDLRLDNLLCILNDILERCEMNKNGFDVRDELVKRKEDIYNNVTI